MRWFRFAVLVLVAAVLQAGLLENFDFKPDLLLILLVFFGVYCRTSDAIITSFTIGFAADLIGPAMGPQIISFGLFGSLLAYLHRVIVIRKMPYQALTIFITGLLTGVLAHLLNLLKERVPASGVWGGLFGISLCSAVIGPFLFLPSLWWMRIRTHRPSRY
ncbi:MAG TPA: rod shape-determining protein MreD [Sedimentisphaerales bacterium]|nr:rod shape-determining protein MreD [Sedimentisphaerales bacterium]